MPRDSVASLGNTFPRKRFKPEVKVHILQQYILISQSRNSRHYPCPLSANMFMPLLKNEDKYFLLKSQHYHRPAWENQQDQQGERVSGYNTSEEPALENKDKNSNSIGFHQGFQKLMYFACKLKFFSSFVDC